MLKDIILFHHALEKNYSDLTCRYFKNIPNYIDKKKIMSIKYHGL